MNEENITELVEQAVEEATADLRDEVESLQEENAELREELDDLRETVEPEGMGSNVTVSGSIDATNRRLAEMNARIAGVEEAVDAVDAVEEAGGDADALKREDLTPMEQIVALPEHVAAEQFDNEAHRNTYRARSVVRDFFDYSEKLPVGHAIRNRDLTRILTAQEDGGHVESKTGERVIRRIAELSKGAFEHVTPDSNKRGEHMVVLPDPDALASHRAADEAVSEGR